MRCKWPQAGSAWTAARCRISVQNARTSRLWIQRFAQNPILCHIKDNYLNAESCVGTVVSKVYLKSRSDSYNITRLWPFIHSRREKALAHRVIGLVLPRKSHDQLEHDLTRHLCGPPTQRPVSEMIGVCDITKWDVGKKR